MMTLQLKTVLPSLKPSEDKLMRSGVIYELTCPCCLMCYVGQTGLLQRAHLESRSPENPSQPTQNTEEQVEILQSTACGEGYLLTL